MKFVLLEPEELMKSEVKERYKEWMVITHSVNLGVIRDMYENDNTSVELPVALL